MTNEELRAIALEVADKIPMEAAYGWDEDDIGLFATRFLAATAEKAGMEASNACDMIDRYLRNNLDDSDYAEYSAALDAVWNHPAIEPAHQQASRDLQHEHTMNQFKEVCHGRNCKANKAQPTHSNECKADHDEAVGAAPLPDEVREIVERLRAYPTRDGLLAAGMLERLARQVPEGCVVVQRTVTEDVKCVLATPGNYRTYQDQWAALIAAGEGRS